jgi:WD40 repeat protein/tRNA A-37 threonylcarbamoyl transferase component Bud32
MPASTSDGLIVKPAAVTPTVPPANGRELQQVGRFEVGHRLGAGAFAAVYRARDSQLDRDVALKLPHPGSLDSPQRVERFLREAKAAAGLRHPNIVPLYESGRDGERYYIASAFIAGTTLADVLADANRVFNSSRAAQIVRALAEALAYAHEQGVVHRDVKPANVMLDAKGQPLLMDFGLASRKDSESKLTNDGAVLGTPSYMAPEQASGKSGEAGPAADQYSLGCVLFELLTGQTPFDGVPEAQVFHHVRTQPTSPRQVNSTVPADLAAVCLKCLEKEPAGRYPDCGALAEDLRRFLTGEQTTARPLGPATRAFRWGRRNKVVACLAVGLLLALLVGVLASSLLALRAVRGEDEARAQTAVAQQYAMEAERLTQEATEGKSRAIKDAGLARRREYSAAMQLVQSAWEHYDASRVAELLKSQIPTGEQTDLRGFEWHYWNKLLHRSHLTLRGHSGGVYTACFSPDGRLAVSGGGDGQVRLWDAATGHEIRALQAHKENYSVRRLVFDADGRRFASAGNDGAVRIWGLADRKSLLDLKGHEGEAVSVSFSPDGRMLASGGGDKLVRIWDAGDGHEIRALRGHEKGIGAVSFSPDGRRLASASDDCTVRVWDTTNGKELFSPLRVNEWSVNGVCFSPDGLRLASCGFDGVVRIWNASDGKPVSVLRGHVGLVRGVEYSRDGGRLLSCGRDGTIRLWDATDGKELAALRGHLGSVVSARFSPDGKRIISAGSVDSTARLWTTNVTQGPITIGGHTAQATSIAFSPDGRSLVSGDGSGTVRLLDVVAGQEIRAMRGHAGAVQTVDFSPDGRRVASCGDDGTIRLWDATDGKEVLRSSGNAGSIVCIAFSPDGLKLATGAGDGTLGIWQAVDGASLQTLRGHSGRAVGVRFSPDGRLVASAGEDGTARVWDITARTEVRVLRNGPAVSSVDFSPDGRRLVTTGGLFMTRIWQVADGRELMNLQGHTEEAVSACFSPDGRRIVSGGGDWTVRIWDADEGKELLRLQTNRYLVNTVTFSRDGRRLAASDVGGLISVWDATDGE